jgi:plasmid stabilization system protein ParE
MARKPRKLKVEFSHDALDTLEEIWKWNARTYNPEHAQSYTDFLESKANSLAINYLAGKIVPTRPEIRYITLKRKVGGHGHVAVYEIINDKVYVLNFYHTAQDWQSKI